MSVKGKIHLCSFKNMPGDVRPFLTLEHLGMQISSYEGES